MSKFVRTIGKTRFNNFSFEIYENKDGSATIRPNKLTHDLPKQKWVTYKNLEELENCLETILDGATGVDAVRVLIARFL